MIGVTKAEYDKIINKFTKVTNTGISEVKDVTVKSGEDVELPESVTAYYSDGSTANMGVTWNTDGIDFSKAGTYTVNGMVNQTEYTNPLIEQRADPQIKYDEDTKAYYFTASYPAFYNADNGYDRIILRKADTIQGLSDAEGGLEKEITIWKAPSTGKMARHVWHRKFIRSKENGMYSLQPAIPATSGISGHMSWYAREMIHTMHLHGYRQTELQRSTQLQVKNPHTSNTCHWI